MDLEKCGKYIADKRVKAGLTQKELAEKIGVTDKAVSKWETGRGFPDSSLLPQLAGALGVTAAELLSGEDAPRSGERENGGSAAEEALHCSNKTRRTILGAILTVLGVGIASLPFYAATAAHGPTVGAAIIIGAAAAAVGIFLLAAKNNPINRISLRAAEITALALSVCAVAAEIPSFGVIMKFGAPEGESAHIVTCSYFSLLPYGYGIITPFFTAIISVITALLGALLLFAKPGGRLGGACFVCGIFAAVLSVVHAVFFFGTLTAQSALVTLLLIFSAVMRGFARRKQRRAAGE